ncbi:hypothetical protein VQ056_26055 [Paenibacillus sp. JTLBN-2024]
MRSGVIGRSTTFVKSETIRMSRTRIIKKNNMYSTTSTRPSAGNRLMSDSNRFWPGNRRELRVSIYNSTRIRAPDTRKLIKACWWALETNWFGTFSAVVLIT